MIADLKRARIHPLHIIANTSFILALVLVFGMLYGLYQTESYPSSQIFNTTLFTVIYSIAAVAIYRQNTLNKLWAFRVIIALLALPIIYLLIIGGNLDKVVTTNQLVTQNWLLYLRITYYGSVICMSICLNALNFRSNVPLDKSTIPWTVNVSGLMMYLIGLSYSARFSILYYYDVPLYKNSRFVVLFVLMAIALLTLQYFGKYGPLYRNRDGRQAFSSISCYLFVISWIHILMPLPEFIATYYQYTPAQVELTHVVSRTAAAFEVIACAVIFVLMRHALTKKYYKQFPV